MPNSLILKLPSPPKNKTGWPWTEVSEPLSDSMPDGSPWPKISIVTPSYNQGQYIEETIRSVLLQGYPNLEYIIIDGGSTDGSVEIIKKYEPWLAYWESEKDMGQSHAINKGWRRSSGDLLAWINSDDFLVKNALHKVALKFQNCNNESLGFIHGKAQIISASGEPLYDRGAPFDLLNTLRSSHQSVAQSSAYFSAEVVRKIDYLDESLHMSMDFDLYVRIAKNYQPYFIQETLSFFRMTESSKTATVEANFGPDHIKTLDKFFSNDQIAPKFLRIKNEAYCKAYLRSFQGYMRLKELKKARRSYLLSLSHSPISCLKETKGYYITFLLFAV